VGNVKAVPSAAITWGTSGTVGDVYYNVGDSISEGTVIAKLADSSVSASILEAQSDLLSAQYELDRVMNSDSDFQTAAQALETPNMITGRKKTPGIIGISTVPIRH
jgi:multidrug efflux pump subunit AcrA (membrane-fusion protein)